MGKQDVDLLRQTVELGGGAEKIDKQHAKGKLTARERVALLLDGCSFLESDVFSGNSEYPGEGVVTGFGTVDGRPVYVYAQDFTVLGGSLGRAHAAKICKVLDLAAKSGVPVVALLDSAGARLQEGLGALAGYGEVCRRSARYAGLIQQIGVVCGPCIGAAAYAAALMDFVFLSGKEALLQTWGPQVTSAALGKVQGAELTGVAQMRCADERECIARVRELLALLPANNEEGAPVCAATGDLNAEAAALGDLVPGLYDMKQVLSAISDNSYFFETSAAFAPNLLTGFARVNGRTVGVVANQPKVLDGALDAKACDKAARLICFCDRFRIPVLSLVDSAGLPASAAEEDAGLVGHGAALLRAYAASTVAKVTVVCGRAPGNAFTMMGNRAMGIDTVYAWPQAQISVAAPDTMVAILHAGEVAAAENPTEARERLVEHYKQVEADPLHAAKAGLVDDVIAPANTRGVVAAALEMLVGKRDAKHGVWPQ